MQQNLRSIISSLLIAIMLLYGSFFVVNHSNFYYLFFGNLLLLTGLSFLVETILYILIAFIKRLKSKQIAIVSTSRSTFIVLFIAEVILRFTGIMQTYPERADGKYFSMAKQEKLNSWYWAHTPNTVISNQKKEFLFQRNVNSLGISEMELSQEKGSKLRILALGDSFTEGVGTSYENSWVKQMETRWKSNNIETINGGIGGSDPIYEFVLYRDKLINYHPDILIITINSTDITDVAGRGGFERFHNDGTAGKDAPSWEWLYATNHIIRLIINANDYSSSLLKNVHSKEAELKAILHIKEALSKLKTLTSEQKTKLLVVLQPSIQEFEGGIHTPFFGQTELAKFLKEKQFHFLDSSIDFKKNVSTISHYYYPLDSHFNEKGYSLFGKTIYEKIEDLGFLD